MSKQLLTGILVVVIAIFVAVGVFLGMRLSSDQGGGPSPYSAVYLSSGDIYYGKFSRFPSPHMTDTWYLQRSADAQNQAQLSVAPLKEVFWGPSGKINFNPHEIVFWTRLRSDSPVAQVIANPQPVTQPPAPQPPAQTSIENNSSTQSQ